MEYHKSDAVYEPLRYVLSGEEEGFTLRSILRTRMQVSRRLASRLKRVENGITVNGICRYMDYTLHEGDVVELRMPIETSEQILPQEMPLSIIYEDDYLIALHKPAGLIVHPTHGHYTGTLANGVMHYWSAGGKSYRFRPMHRLDEDTSGVVAVAKSAYVHHRFSQFLESRLVEKTYLAIVHGCMREKSGIIDGPIDRDPNQPHIRIVTQTGLPSVTHYQVERSSPQASIVRIRLETGRTHQIRVHMQSIGHPLIGDKLYRLPKFDPVLFSDMMDRQALHAYELRFPHPVEDRLVDLKAELPPDMKKLLERLQ